MPDNSRSKSMQARTFKRSAIAVAVAGAFAVGAVTADRISLRPAQAAVTPAVAVATTGAAVRRVTRFQRAGRSVRRSCRQHQRHRGRHEGRGPPAARHARHGRTATLLPRHADAEASTRPDARPGLRLHHRPQRHHHDQRARRRRRRRSDGQAQSTSANSPRRFSAATRRPTSPCSRSTPRTCRR